MYNIQKAVSRLEFAPKLKEIEVTDIKKGLGVFTPKPDKPVTFAALKATLKKAGYTLASAEITVAGTLARNDNAWAVVVEGSGQQIVLAGPNVDQAIAGANAGDRIEIMGEWKTAGTGSTSYETVSPPRKANSVGQRLRTSSPVYVKVGSFQFDSSTTETEPSVEAALHKKSLVVGFSVQPPCSLCLCG